MTRRNATLVLALLVASLAWAPAAAATCSEPVDGLALCDTDGDGTPETAAASAGHGGAGVSASCTGLGEGVTPVCSDATTSAEAGHDGTRLGAEARCGGVTALGHPCPLDLRAGVDASTAAGNASVAGHVRPIFVSVCEEDPETGFTCLP